MDEPVRLVAYDPAWPARFLAERDRIAAVLGGGAVAIEHIGSTAVPGMVAKPIVDVLVGVRPPLAGHGVERLGYEAMGEAGVPGRLHFRRRAPGDDVNVHVVEHGGRLWREDLRFRDALRAHPDLAADYAAAKRAAAAAAPESLLRYSELKADAVAAVLERA